MKALVRQHLFASRRPTAPARGFTLIELVMTLTVRTVMTLGVIPLIKVSVKRQREQRLREELRQMRTAIDQFHREAVMGALIQQRRPQGGQIPQVYIDPRVRVGITDQLIFGSDNPDRYPPTLEILVQGVSVTPLATGPPDPNKPPSESGALSTKKKVYLRAIPVDPMTGEANWRPYSTFDAPDSPSWGGENVFDVRSSSDEIALDGTKYSDW